MIFRRKSKDSGVQRHKPKCSFCGKPNDSMVAGPGVRVCGTCIDLCDEVLAAADHP